MLTLTCCQDHILTENIWFLWSETSYSGHLKRKKMISTPLMMENPVRSPMDETELGLNLDLLVSLDVVKGRRVKVDLHQLEG